MTVINAKIKAILVGIVFRNAYAADLEPQQSAAQILSAAERRNFRHLRPPWTVNRNRV